MNGVINLYKERGITSFGAVARVRRILGVKKVGHTGTLDPEAEGVLPICVGKATKLVDYLMAGKKIYRAGFRFGAVSDTLDAFGEVTPTGKPIPEKAQVEESLLAFVGEISQIPPMYSALKQEGKRLYELARQGVEVEREARQVTIETLVLTAYGEGEGELLLTCSKGTYVRSLIDDLGRALGCGAIMTSLVREGTGDFDLTTAVRLNTLEEEGPAAYLLSMEDVLRGYAALTVPEAFEKLILNGMKVRDARLTAEVKPGLYRGYTAEGTFMGILERDAETLFLKVNLR